MRRICSGSSDVVVLLGGSAVSESWEDEVSPESQADKQSARHKVARREGNERWCMVRKLNPTLLLHVINT